MVDRRQASITIGGILPAALLGAFIELIQDEGLSTEWDGPAFDVAELAPDDALRLMANEVAWGRFDRLEAFCVEHGLPFARWSGACVGCWNAELTVFTGSGEPHFYAATDDDDVMIGRHTAEALGSFAEIIAYFNAADFVVPPLTVSD